MKFSKEVNKFAQSCKRWANRNSFKPEGCRIYPVDGGYLVRVPMSTEWSRGFFFNGNTVTVFKKCPNPLKWEDHPHSGQVMDYETFNLVYGG